MIQLLKDKKCVITSGAHGLGYEIAKLFSQHGAAVAICGLDESGEESAKELRKYNKSSFFQKCDMSDMEQVEVFANKVIEKFDSVDILVNNVGINIKELVVDIDLVHYDKVQDTNLKSAILLTKIIVKNMLANHINGSIINISSMNALAPSPTTASYCASKGGMNAFTQVLAVELGKYGIRANAICPGWVATSYIMKDVQEGIENGKTKFEILEEYNGSSPLIAPARGRDIANHALFFASDMSEYITGFVLKSDGAAVLQAHTCDYPEPPDSVAIRKAYYDTITN